ncbi:phenylalanine-tRNA ligase, alpha subunit [Aphanomyces invadans]|uniref:phenylalanine--tRNA ligase n=1 Tax=Aphanomyces invadans TaxID=157072 RepID=A0A024TWJ7_9STRA|nr:phenylalanine-tRNA ligase, alpha subunit [Aphanomyces invadans]ETV97996.1 phenylalanine-tRNA ligase, alpha subunit [Aphanomyces invadans]|eukprot:XP_008873557.1 phenylalanine-tRNA ligase, alpha subunit [Aphanomyces invadans]
MSYSDQEKLAAETQLLQFLHASNTVDDTFAYASNQNLDHELVVGVVKSLLVDAFVTASDLSTSFWVLSDEAESFLAHGSPEVQLFHAIPASEGADKVTLEGVLGAAHFKVAQGACMKNKWIRMDKATGLIFRNVETVKDTATEQLKLVASAHGSVDQVPDDVSKDLKRRKLISLQVRKSYRVGKGPNFALQRKRQAAGLNKDLLDSEEWKTEKFKPYNFNTMGLAVGGGHLHPLMKVRAEFRRVLMDMGFDEMPTNRWVESSFWNFDALFQPQSHPARDAHDTFFLTTPAKAVSVPEDYFERVRDMHEHGGHGSIGHGRGAFTRDESFKNLLRTHTTAVSARMLYKLANQPGGFTPQKYFSIDRVFRNESMDATHLAEFHQVEGVIADYDLSLGDLIGVISGFFKKIGITQMRFKPAYNPYTEPSMEVFAYHPDLKKWTEIGNSGVFRPEMLRPMGLPENVRVIAWGLSLERPTMIKYRLSNIRDLFGHKVDLEQTKSAKLYRM